MRISALQPMSQDTISILERAGSRGNSTIRRPVGVKAPEEAQKPFSSDVSYQRDTDRRGEDQDGLLTVGNSC